MHSIIRAFALPAGGTVSWSRTLKVRQLIRARIEAGEEIALLFSDIRGFSSFTAEQGDRAAYQLSRLHDEILRERIDEHGVLVKSLGDGIMAAFEEPLHAIQASVSIQQAIRELNQQDASVPIDLGIGISSGTPVMTDIDFIGHAVNMSQRLSSLAKGGQILITDRIRDDVRLPDGLYTIPLGERNLKGVGSAAVYEVAWIREVERISDASDRITLILTERGTIVVEIAKDPKQDLREALAQLSQAQSAEDGAFSAALQRWIGRFTQRLVRAPLNASGVVREQPVEDVDLRLSRARLIVESRDGRLVLEGVDQAKAKRFVRAAERLRSGG